MSEVGDNAKGQLKSIVERIENIEAEMRARADDRKEIYLEAKSAGFDAPSIRAIVRMRKQDPNKLAEHEAIVENYQQTLGMI